MYQFLLPPQLPEDAGKLTVVLDLDETLVHSVFEHDPLAIEKMETSGLANFWTQKRPYLDDFLSEASKKYELIVYTAGSEDYAKVVLNFLDPHQSIFRYTLFRQHCFQLSPSQFVKDLRILNRDLSRVVLVDDSLHSFWFQCENGVPIVPFYNDGSDQALLVLESFLDFLNGQRDVRLCLNKIFRLRKIWGC